MINVYVVGKVFSDNIWEIVGVFSSREKAESECLDDHYFVGPLVLDAVEQNDHTVWPNAYYPTVQPHFTLDIQDGKLGTTGGL